jgi:hypothetical protein
MKAFNVVSSTTAVNSHLSCKEVKERDLIGPQLGNCLWTKSLKEQ